MINFVEIYDLKSKKVLLLKRSQESRKIFLQYIT